MEYFPEYGLRKIVNSARKIVPEQKQTFAIICHNLNSMAASKREKSDKLKSISWVEVAIILVILTLLLTELFLL